MEAAIETLRTRLECDTSYWCTTIYTVYRQVCEFSQVLCDSLPLFSVHGKELAEEAAETLIARLNPYSDGPQSGYPGQIRSQGMCSGQPSLPDCKASGKPPVSRRVAPTIFVQPSTSACTYTISTKGSTSSLAQKLNSPWDNELSPWLQIVRLTKYQNKSPKKRPI